MTGTIISIVFGIAGIICTYFIARWQMKKNEIDHYYINSYDIGKGLTDVFPGFALHYGEEILSDSVKVLMGGFINVGRNDIGENGKQTGIKLVLPEECVVKAVKVFPLVHGLIVKPAINNKDGELKDDNKKIDNDNKNVIAFCIDGILKHDECFNYAAIIEVPNHIGELFDQLDFDHRIKNTTIRNLYLGQSYQKTSKASKVLPVLSIIYVLLVFGWIVSVFLKPDMIDVLSFNLGGLSFDMTAFLGILFGASVSYLALIMGKKGRLIKKLNHIKNKQK